MILATIRERERERERESKYNRETHGQNYPW